MRTGFSRDRKMASVTVDIFEEGVLTVRHVFYGETLARAREVEKAHRKSDSFYGSAVGDKEFKGIRLSTKRYEEGGGRE